MKNFPFIGTGVALITPFKTDLSVDVEALTAIVEHVITQGVDYLVALGTTSEAPVLKATEKALVLQTILNANSGRVPVVLGIGGNDTAAIVQQIEQTDFTEIAGILSVTPYYNKPNQKGLFEHYSAVATACPVPIILYNVPGRTGINMKAATTLELALRYKNIVAIKEASGDVGQIMQIIAHKPENFHVISGDDALTLPLIAAGASGVISVIANALCRDFSGMVKAQLKNNQPLARQLHYKIFRFYDLLFAEGNPAGVKALLNNMQLCKNVLRLPLTPVSDALFEQIALDFSLLNNPNIK